MPKTPEEQEKQLPKPSEKTASELKALQTDVIKKPALLRLFIKGKAYIDFKENRFVCTIDQEGKISSIKFRDYDIFFEKSALFENFNVIAFNLIKAWEKIGETPFYFKPAEKENFTSPDGFNFFAKDYCVSPKGVIKTKSRSAIEQDGQLNTVIFYGEDNKPLGGYEWTGEVGNSGRFFISGKENKRVYNFEEAKKEDPNLTAKEYLEMAAENLDAPEKLEAFFDTFIQYKYDSGDYWQLPEETVARIENGRMIGDCDDYAIFAQRILKLQGKHALALIFSPPDHAECFWVEREAFGYIGYSLGTYGLDKQRAPTLDLVVDALLEKWRKEGKMYVVQNREINVIDIDSPGQRQIVKMPIAALTDKWMYEGLRKTINPNVVTEVEEEEALFTVRNYREGNSNSQQVLELCEKMMEIKSNNVLFYKILFGILFEKKSFDVIEQKFDAICNVKSGYSRKIRNSVIFECAKRLVLSADSYNMFVDKVFAAFFEGDFPQEEKDKAWIDYARWLCKVGLPNRALIFLQQAINGGQISNTDEAKAEILRLKKLS